MQSAGASPSNDSDVTEVLEYDDVACDSGVQSLFAADDDADMYSTTASADEGMYRTTDASDDVAHNTTNRHCEVQLSSFDVTCLETLRTTRSSNVDMPSARNSVEEALDLGDDYVKSIGSDEAAIASAVIIPDGGDTGDDEEQDSESSLNYGIDSDEEDALSMNTVLWLKYRYTLVLGISEKNLHRLNEFVYTHKTRYISTFRVGKEYLCRSHQDCHHSIKLITHHAGELGIRFQVPQIGQHTGAVVNLRTRDISPVIKPEIDALLKVGMSAGRVRNMMMFKYLRDPSMVALIPETKTMENRKAHLKKKAEEGWKNDQVCHI
ncbi:hypothetical protein GN244_ATG00612 [Phytophthora infestans]|uniref:Uncharacterized protein n=1 Tax=Phytophthora infestans TaxID=4787 RepID=A0A833TMQ6_PHYIN|nr:hypothetical protein GN244_ATG00612 [Phytophthora infestans]